jgi:hypothetical protein
MTSKSSKKRPLDDGTGETRTNRLHERSVLGLVTLAFVMTTAVASMVIVGDVSLPFTVATVACVCCALHGVHSLDWDG